MHYGPRDDAAYGGGHRGHGAAVGERLAHGLGEFCAGNFGSLGQINEHLRVDDVVVNELGRPAPVFALVGTRTRIRSQPAKPMFVLGAVPNFFLLLLPAIFSIESAPACTEVICFRADRRKLPDDASELLRRQN